MFIRGAVTVGFTASQIFDNSAASDPLCLQMDPPPVPANPTFAGGRCNVAYNPYPARVLTRTATEPAGANCPNGGQKLEIGFDSDSNGSLSSGEVYSTEYLCSAAPSSLIKVSAASAAECPHGGQKFEVGGDDNEDGVLDANEVESTQVVCNGADGTNGTNGLTALAATSSEPAGANCPNGGTKLQFGLDDDADGVLDPAEVDSTSYACNGIDGLNVLATVTAEPAGANCASGGQKIETGADADADGVLDPAEIQNTAYVCNGTNGTNGLSGLVASTPEPAGANCPNGGTKLDFGLDDDGNGVLDPTEVDSTSYACNGIDGLSVVTSVTPEPAGANCANGGQKIEVGQDANRNGQLDAPEVQGTSYVCNGVDGTNGTDGKQTLIDITTEPAGANCAEGGQKLDYGVDDDGNGQLDADEIDGTRYLCSGLTGQNGHSTLVTVEPIPAGDTCAFGGQSILTGLDLNDDGVLDASEVTGNTSICNASPGEQGEKGDKGDKGDPGADGKSSLISVEAASAEACAAGGQTVKTGLDANGNGTLDAEEVSSSIDICQSTCTVKGGGDQNTVITCSDGTSSTIRAGGCSAAGGAGAWTWLLGLAGLPLIRRRRRA